MHPFVTGDVTCGNLPDRRGTLEALAKLPLATLADHSEAMHLVEERRLVGPGIGWIEVHLLASALITGCKLWTLDTLLQRDCRELLKAIEAKRWKSATIPAGGIVEALLVDTLTKNRVTALFR